MYQGVDEQRSKSYSRKFRKIGLLYKISKLGATSRSVVFFYGARVVAAMAGFFTVKFLIAYLSKENYGYWGMLGAVSAMLIPILTLQLPAAMMRMYFDYSEDDELKQNSLVTTCLLLGLTSIGILLSGVLFLYAVGFLEKLMALFIALGTSGMILTAFFTNLTRVRDDYGIYFFNQVFDRIGFMILLAWAETLFDDSTLTSYENGRLLVTFFFFASVKWFIVFINLVCFVYRRAISPWVKRLRWPEIVALIKFSWPLSLTFFLGWTLSQSDVYLLKRLSTLVEVADYHFAAGIAAFVTLITQSILTDWPRFYYAQMRDNREDRDERIARRVRMFLWFHVCGILIIRLIAGVAYAPSQSEEEMIGV